MGSFKEPSFSERTAAAARAKAEALAKLRSKPPVDAAVTAERIARAEAREAADAEKRRAKEAARAEAEATKLREAEEQALAASKKIELTEAEKKAARDARYAARKSRK